MIEDKIRHLLLASKNSGGNKSDINQYSQYITLHKLKKMIEDHGGRVLITGNSHDYISEVETQVMIACQHKPDIIYLLCGDGGILTFLTALITYWPYTEAPFPLIAHPKGGTFGILADRLNIHDPIEYVKNILKIKKLCDLTVKDIKMMRIEDDSSYSHISFSVGTGFPVKLLEEAYKKKHLKNVRVALMTLRSIYSAILKSDYHRRFDGLQKMTLTAQSHAGELETIEKEWLGIAAQSISSLGLPRFMPYREGLFWKSEQAEDTFHAIGIDYNFRRFLRHVPTIFLGEADTYRDPETNEKRQTLALDKQLKSLIIDAEYPFPFQTCGELSLGPRPCITSKLYIHAYKSIRFIAGQPRRNKNGK